DQRTEFPITPSLKVMCSYTRKSSSRAVILVSADPGSFPPAPNGEGFGQARISDLFLDQLSTLLLDRGYTVILACASSAGERADQFADFYTTYNRTEVQERVRDLVRVCAFARGYHKVREVILCGLGRA